MIPIVVDVRDSVRTIALDRPEVKNALTRPLTGALRDAMLKAARAPDTRAVILTGRGGSFCSGADLKEGLQDPSVLADLDGAVRAFHELVRAVTSCPKPVIALVDGPAVGFGCDLALACDLRVATDRAYFQEKFVRIGLIPDGGGTFFLPRLVGLARAAELMMLGDRLEAADALRLGVVNRVAPPAEAEAVARDLATRLANGPPLALRLMKECMLASLGGGLDPALDRERAAQVRCLGSADMMEGVMAFFEKRPPRFEGEK